MPRPRYVRLFEVGPQRYRGPRGVEHALEAIGTEFLRRSTTAFVDEQKFGLSPNEAAKNFLRREIYALGRSLKSSPRKWDVVATISKRRISKITRPEALEANVFHALFLGVFEEDNTISRQERAKMAKELLYADRHHVPPEYLCGFIYQSGGRDNLEQKLQDTKYIEPAFQRDENWE